MLAMPGCRPMELPAYRLWARRSLSESRWHVRGGPFMRRWRVAAVLGLQDAPQPPTPDREGVATSPPPAGCESSGRPVSGGRRCGDGQGRRRWTPA